MDNHDSILGILGVIVFLIAFAMIIITGYIERHRKESKQLLENIQRKIESPRNHSAGFQLEATSEANNVFGQATENTEKDLAKTSSQ